MTNTNQQEPLHPNVRAFYDGIEAQKKVGAEARSKHEEIREHGANRSKVLVDAVKSGDLSGLTASERAELIETRAKALSSALRAKR